MGRSTQPLRAARAWSEGSQNETSYRTNHPRQCSELPLGNCSDHQVVDVTGEQKPVHAGFCFFDFGAFLVVEVSFFATRCCGGVFAITPAARSKRFHASGCSSIPVDRLLSVSLGDFMSDTPTNPPDFLPWLSVKGAEKVVPPELAKHLAGILIEWGSFESAVLMDCESFRQWPVVKSLIPEIPHGFKKRIELWKLSINTLYPTIGLYVASAKEITEKSKFVANRRNRIIHGHWMPNPGGKPDEFMLLPENFPHGSNGPTLFDTERADMLFRDVMAVSNAFHSFLITRTIHAREGLTQLSTGQPHGSQDRPKPPIPEKPPRQPKPSSASRRKAAMERKQ
jgi:hypothetical protein